MNQKQLFRLNKLAATLALLTVLLGMVTLARAQTGSTSGSDAAISGGGGGVIPETIDLRPQWTAGQTSRYEFWNQMQQTAEATLGDRSQTTTGTIEVEGEVTWTVDKVNADGSSVCTMTLDWMKFTNTPGEGTAMVIDSRKSASADTKVMHELLSAMAEVGLTVEIAPDGHVTAVKGLDKMKNKTSQPDFIPTELDFEETASDLAAIAYAPQPFAYESAGGGKAWNADFRWEHDLGKMNQKWAYELARVEDIAGVPEAVVTGEGRFKLDPEEPDGRPADAPPTPNRRDGAVALLAPQPEAFDRVLVAHQPVGQHLAGPVQSAHDRADGDLQDLADLAVLQPVDAPHQQHLAVLGLEVLDRILERLVDLLPVEPGPVVDGGRFVRRRPIGRLAVERLDGGRLAVLLLDPRVEDIVGDREEPAPHRAARVGAVGFILKPLDGVGSEGSGEDLLHDVVGVLGLAGQVHRHAIDRVHVLQREAFKEISFHAAPQSRRAGLGHRPGPRRWADHASRA